MLKTFLLSCAAGLLLLLFAGAGGLYYLVVAAPGEEISRENIRNILAVESPIFYRDGVTKIGVFFQDQHRQYVPFADIPTDFINAIIAAEDHDFFRHHGIDFSGIFRAAAANLKAGRVVQGGSTLTQQTAKNLFKRKDRSLASKFKELIYALRLECHYSKEDILEFYANQFYVSGNGHGLAVAARYFFDKEVGQLDLRECAFIAACVKRPNAYNPFTKRSEEAVRQAGELARARTGYVLDQMLQLGMISEQLHAANRGKPVPFRQGQTSYGSNTLIDLVRSAIDHREVQAALAESGIDNIATSGARIVTTFDEELQGQAMSALREELSRLDVRLAGYDREDIRRRYAAVKGAGNDPRPDAYLFGSVTSVDRKAHRVSVDLNGASGVIDYEGLFGMLEPLVRFRKGRWSEARKQDMPMLLEQIGEGDPVYVRVRSGNEEEGYLLDLAKYPEIQGGAIVLHDGRIVAMAGGMENEHFNRAVHAKRTVGSVFKPLLYAGAQQLGWTPADLLQNRRDVFVFFRQSYFPRPDHPSENQQVSLSWAGVTSENVASVWLLYHLCDQLTPAQFREVAGKVGLGRGAEESVADYRRRIRDQVGIVLNRDTLYRAAFEEAVRTIEPDLVFDGRLQELEVIRRLHYAIEGVRWEDEAKLTPAERKEQWLQQDIARYSYVDLQAAARALRLWRLGEPVDGGLYWKDNIYAFFAGRPPAGWTPMSREESVVPDDLLLGGLLSESAFNDLAGAVEREYGRISRMAQYSDEQLAMVHDFRVLVGLRYLIGLCRQLGIDSRLEPVLSFPLGSNVVSLFEAAHAYEGLMRDGITTVDGDAASPELYAIERIEDSDGEVIYEPGRTLRQVIDPRIALATRDILRNVVLYGTGQQAKAIRLSSRDEEQERYFKQLKLVLPVYGKTGTANDFTNASFVGFLPGPDSGGLLNTANGYVVAAYVGYDDNRSMAKGSTHITGAAGALPVWMKLVAATAGMKDYLGRLDAVDMSFAGSGVAPERPVDLGQTYLPVDAERGGIPAGSRTGTADPRLATVLAYPDGEGVERIFSPFWKTVQ
ncbi:MAG: transglycosylase domain-containing protein [Thermodesulfobacteriota bacterium]